MKLTISQAPNGIDQITFTSDSQSHYYQVMTSLCISIAGKTLAEKIQNIINGLEQCATKKLKHGPQIRVDALREVENWMAKNTVLFGEKKPEKITEALLLARKAYAQAFSLNGAFL